MHVNEAIACSSVARYVVFVERMSLAQFTHIHTLMCALSFKSIYCSLCVWFFRCNDDAFDIREE